MRRTLTLVVLGITALQASAAEVWTVRIEEPTGLYPRTNEIISVPFSKLGGKQKAWKVVDPAGRELPWQAIEDALMFPVTLIPGQLPEYHVAPSPETPTNFVNQIRLRPIGMTRLELGNQFFRVIIDLHSGAIIEAFNLGAQSHRILNLVETTPEGPAALKDDIHAAEAMGIKPVAGVPEENIGWTSLGGSGPITHVDFVETGPLRGRVRLARTNETWELVWSSESRALRWRTQKGFRFTAISATPYVPFDRCVDGSEYRWPSGPDDEEPPDHDIGPRAWNRLPGGHMVYYHHTENYGALGIVALDTNLNWIGAGSRKFIAQRPQGETEIAITFPDWRGSNTVLQARREHRILRHPVIVTIEKARDETVEIRVPAERSAFNSLERSVQGVALFKPEVLSLDGDWELAWCEKGEGPPTNGWRTVKVPGTAHTQWLDPAKIYTRQAEWVSAKEWWYRRKFEIPAGFVGKQQRLQFEATDYYADAWLNGELLGRHEGYMDPYEYEVSSKTRAAAANELLVRAWTPVGYYWKHRPYTGKGSYGAVDQKPDDITALGITRSVRLIASERIFIKDIAVDTRLTDGTNAEVEVTVELNEQPGPGQKIEVTLSPRNFASNERSRAVSVATVHRTLLIPVINPQLWWTWDHGKPNLYNLDVRLLDENGGVTDGRSQAVGIREIERVGWIFYLNRKRLFIRGTNYYYHLYMSEMDRAKYERDLRLMLQMNVNLIRLHCHFSNPEFYDLADEMGVMIWQDFLEAWYPEDRAFSLKAAELYDPLIRSVRNHPSIACWITSDEESVENYRDLTKHLAPRPALLDPQRRAVTRSTGRFGDAHVYHGWYGGSIWEYTNMTEAFVSELGATSLPNYDTLSKFMPDSWPINQHEDEWFFRRLQIPEAMHAWGEPGSLTLKEYIPRTQAYVSRLFQIALERSRRLKYNPAGGICHFHAIDIWPSVTMAAIDFERVPTKVFYTVQRSFAPICASLEYERDTWKQGEPFQCRIWAINDTWEPMQHARIRWRIIDHHEREQAAGEFAAEMEADSARPLGSVEWRAIGKGQHELRAEVHHGERLLSENVFEFEVTE